MNDEKEKLVGVKLPLDLIKSIQKEANSRERSLSGQIRYILKEWEIKHEKESR